MVEKKHKPVRWGSRKYLGDVFFRPHHNVATNDDDDDDDDDVDDDVDDDDDGLVGWTSQTLILPQLGV